MMVVLNTINDTENLDHFNNQKTSIDLIHLKQRIVLLIPLWKDMTHPN